jgi:hypothetical protein
VSDARGGERGARETLSDLAIITDDDSPMATVESDDGASYRVKVDGATRTFVDWPANCQERARKVAVIVALALQSPVIEIGAAHEIAPAISLAHREASAQLMMQIETGGVVEGAPSAGLGSNTAGLDLQVVIGARM